MSRAQVFLFCVLSLAATLGVCAVLFPYASMSSVEVETAGKPRPMEDFDLVDLGEDYGMLSVFDLVGYYLDNPPQPPAAGAAPRKKHFGGC